MGTHDKRRGGRFRGRGRITFYLKNPSILSPHLAIANIRKRPLKRPDAWKILSLSIDPSICNHLQVKRTSRLEYNVPVGRIHKVLLWWIHSVLLPSLSSFQASAIHSLFQTKESYSFFQSNSILVFMYSTNNVTIKKLKELTMQLSAI